MIEWIVIKLSNSMETAGVIQSDDIAVYRYGLELFVSSTLNIVFIVLLSVLLGYPLLSIPYIISFVSLRMFAGGFHARTHWFCIFTCSVLYLFSYYIIISLHKYSAMCFCVLIGFISFVILLLFSPNQTENKPLIGIEEQHNRKKSLVIGAVLLMIGIISVMFGIADNMIIKMLFAGELMAIILLIVGVIILHTNGSFRK